MIHSLLCLILLIALIATATVCYRQRRQFKQRLLISQQEYSSQHKQLSEELLCTKDQLSNANTHLREAVTRYESNQLLINETQDYLHSILDSMPSILIGITHEGRITHWNSLAEQATGILSSYALGQQLCHAYPQLPISQQRLSEIINKGKSTTFENLQNGSGPLSQYQDITIYPLQHPANLASKQQNQPLSFDGAVIRIDDVTSRVSLENMIMQHEKLNSLGELAAGLAHELNNPLSTVLQSLQSVNRRLLANIEKNQQAATDNGIELAQVKQYLQQRQIPLLLNNMKLAGDQASQIINNMLEFSHSHNTHYQAEDIASVIDDSLTMTRITVSQSNGLKFNAMTIDKKLPTKLDPIVCGAGELQQVLVNLFKNAYQALAHDPKLDSKTPTITISAEQHEHSLCLMIADNGPGIAANTKRHVFEPFFSTKAVGHGTGLGLSISYFIITKRHQGTIEVESDGRSGSCFIIRLPIETSATLTTSKY